MELISSVQTHRRRSWKVVRVGAIRDKVYARYLGMLDKAILQSRALQEKSMRSLCVALQISLGHWRRNLQGCQLPSFTSKDLTNIFVFLRGNSNFFDIFLNVAYNNLHSCYNKVKYPSHIVIRVKNTYLLQISILSNKYVCV